jgi:DNA-binding LytR/AlgR family response regulator
MLRVDAATPALRCLIVDDQPAATAQLARMLAADPRVAWVKAATNVAGVLRVLRDVDVDVAFIEARTADLDGMDLAWMLRCHRWAPAVVFVTRHPERAADAFDVGALDYVSKPPQPQRLAESLRRVVAVRSPAPAEPAPPATSPAAASSAVHDGSADDEAIPIEQRGTTKLVRRSSVQWAESRRDYVRLHTADGSYLIRAKLAALADRWRHAGLIRIHRSYLVQTRFITGMHVADSGQLVVVVNGRQLPVSRGQATNLCGALLQRRRDLDGQGVDPHRQAPATRPTTRPTTTTIPPGPASRTGDAAGQPVDVGYG